MTDLYDDDTATPPSFEENDFNSFSIAWCPELDRVVRAEDVLLLQSERNDTLTFQCSECRRPLSFRLYEVGLRALVGFVQEKEDGEYDPDLLGQHEKCLRSILKKNIIPDDVFSLHDFENAFVQVDTLVNDLGASVTKLQDAFYPLQQVALLRDAKTENNCAGYRLGLLRESLAQMQQHADRLNREVYEASQAYQNFRRTTRGY